MEKVKILHVTQAAYGGVAEYIKLLLKHMDKNRYESDVVCTSSGNLYKEISDFGIHVKTIDMEREISAKKDFNAFIQLNKYIKESRPDIVYLHSSKAGVIGRLACLANKVPCLYNPHGWAFSMDVSRRKKKFYAFVERACSRFTNAIINISEYEKNLAMVYRIVNPNKIRVIYNGIDVERLAKIYPKEEILEELGIPKDSYIIGMVARITEQKSPEMIVDIAKVLITKIPEAYFLMVGDGELRKKIELKIFEEGLNGRIMITGWTSNVEKYIPIFDVGILTSKWEGFGLALLEYMSQGKPVIASKVGGIPNVIRDSENGLLVEYGDIGGFIEAILKIKEDEKLKEKLINNGYKCVKEKFNIRRVIEEHNKIFEEFVQSNKLCQVVKNE